MFIYVDTHTHTHTLLYIGILHYLHFVYSSINEIEIISDMNVNNAYRIDVLYNVLGIYLIFCQYLSMNILLYPLLRII